MRLRSAEIWIALTLVCLASLPLRSIAQEAEGEKPYRESALRRFEIITLMSLPFTSIQSYLIVRCFEMARQGKVAPKLSDADWKAVQVGAVVLAVAVGIWDWLHTRAVDRNEPLIPNLKPPRSGEAEGYRGYAIRGEF